MKVNPNSPQRSVRLAVLTCGKTLLVPSPRLRKGFMILDPSMVPQKSYAKASTIKGSFKYGRFCPLRELPQVDLIVNGSVAVSRDGIRVGKGGGYSEMEYGVLREIRAVREETSLFTTVHGVQIVDWAPKELHDLIVDTAITPTRILKVKRRHGRSNGIFWQKITEHHLREIPVLSEMKNMTGKQDVNRPRISSM